MVQRMTELDPSRKNLKDHLLTHAVRTGDFVLKSGRKSNWFIDGKQTACHPEGIKLVADIILSEIADIDADGYNEIIAIPDLFASIGDQAWLYVFPGTATGFLNEPLIFTDSPLELTTIRPSNLALVPGESPQLAVAFGAPVRFGMIFDLDISDGTVSLINT